MGIASLDGSNAVLDLDSFAPCKTDAIAIRQGEEASAGADRVRTTGIERNFSLVAVFDDNEHDRRGSGIVDRRGHRRSGDENATGNEELHVELLHDDREAKGFVLSNAVGTYRSLLPPLCPISPE